MLLLMVIRWNEDTRLNREKISSSPREMRTSSTPGTRSCPRELIALIFLELTVIRTFRSFVGIATMKLEHEGVECWVRPAARYW